MNDYEKKVFHMYNNKLSIPQICKILHRSYYKIRDIVIDSGITQETINEDSRIRKLTHYENSLGVWQKKNGSWHKGKRVSKTDKYIPQMIELYNSGLSCEDIGKKLNVYPGCVRVKLKREGIKLRSGHSYGTGITMAERIGKEKADKMAKDHSIWMKNRTSEQIKQNAIAVKKTWNKPEYIEFARKRALKQYASGKFPKQTNTKPERIMKKLLIDVGFIENKDFIHQYNLYNKFSLDFCFPSKRLIIECDGDYWHWNPKLHDINDIKSDFIKKNLRKDKAKEAYIKKIDNSSWTLLRFWDSELSKNPEKCINKVLEYF